MQQTQCQGKNKQTNKQENKIRSDKSIQVQKKLQNVALY